MERPITEKVIITRAGNGVLIQIYDQHGNKMYSAVETEPFAILTTIANSLDMSADIKAEWYKPRT